MTTITIELSGERNNIDDLLKEFNEVEVIEKASVDSINSTNNNILSRDPLNQIELVDIVISLVVNLASSYTYDQIKALIKKRAEAKGFKESTEEN